VLCGGVVNVYDTLVRFLLAHAPVLTIVAYVASPLLAIVSFVLNRLDRKALRRQAEALGQARAELGQAQTTIASQRQEIDSARELVRSREARVEKLERDLRDVTEGSQELWKLRPAKEFRDCIDWRRDPKGAKLITIGNLKGGVGKTTLAANFAAYISETLDKPVLLIDLDYQGSLSNMLMLSIGNEEVASRVDWLFDEAASLATLERARVHLVRKLNRGWLVPANYTFAQLENRLLLQWLLQDDGGLDVRYRLANALLRPEVRRSYSAIILDMPPRMTLGSINALVASHHFIVPTVLDSLSVEAVSQFLTNVRAIKSDLALDVELAGIVGMMTRQVEPSERERRGLELAKEGGYVWRPDTDFVFKTTLPRRVDIAGAAGEDIAYFLADGQGKPLRELFDPLFEEICTAVWRGNGP
jgi:cellulose biosynthesis protein BcsQ